MRTPCLLYRVALVVGVRFTGAFRDVGGIICTSVKDKMKKLKTGTAVLAAAMLAAGSYADSITHGGTTINMDFMDIGYAGNSGDPANTVNGSHPGAVGYSYRIGTYEVTADQWTSVIGADPNVGGGSNGPWGIDRSFWSGSQPTGGASWKEAAKFCNWLTSGSYSQGAYQFSNPYTLTGVDRAAAVSTYGTVYVLPTEDEWYKAAYFKSDGRGYTLYSTGDSAPTAGIEANHSNSGGSPWNVGTGSVENNGTFDMTGNVWELTESAMDGTLDHMDEARAVRGGAYTIPVAWPAAGRASGGVTQEHEITGFRIAAIVGPIMLSGLDLAGDTLTFTIRNIPEGQTVHLRQSADLVTFEPLRPPVDIMGTTSQPVTLNIDPAVHPALFMGVFEGPSPAD